MCDQTEIKYVDGDIVWVKFHNFWWPGEVHGESKLPHGLLKSFRRQPVAVVKFFQENAYEYVKTINDIYQYNCIRKHEFIKKGLDLHRAKKRNMEKFPQDVRIAEEKTGGDPDIIESEEFQPEQKPNIANIFGDQTPKMKKGVGRGRRKATPSDEDFTYSRTKNLSLKAAHTTPTLSASKSYTSSSLGVNRTAASSSASASASSTSTPNPNEFHCHLCNFSTTRLNVIVLHNKTHTSESRVVEPSPAAAKAKKTPVATPARKPGRPRGRKPKKIYVEPIPVDTDFDSASEDRMTQSDSENEAKQVIVKAITKPSPKKRQTKTKAAVKTAEPVEEEADVMIDSDVEEIAEKTSVPKVASPRKTQRSTRKKQSTVQENDQVEANLVVVAEIEKSPEEPIEIKSKLLADWSEDDDDSMVSASKEVTSELDEIKSVLSSPNQSGDEKQPKQQTIRNIPKKDRRGIILDEFYTKQVPSTNETDTEGEQQKDETVVIESDEEIFDITEDLPKEPEIGSTTDEKPPSSPEVEAIETEDDVVHIEHIEHIEDDEDNEHSTNEVVESTTTDNIKTPVKVPDEEDEKKDEIDVNLLKQGADLLEETSQLQKNIETVGIIEKKRRLLNKHKNDEDLDSSENARNSSIDESIEETHTQPIEIIAIEPEQPVDEKPIARRRSSATVQMTTQTVTKTYRSNSRRKTKSSSTSGDEKGQLQSKETEESSIIKGNGTPEILPKIAEDIEIKPIESTIADDQNVVETNDIKPDKMDVDETSPMKSDLDSCKTEVDCFDFKEEEEEMPQTLNRRKRRCLPPGKVFELQTIDKLEEIRKQEENEQAKRLKIEPEETKETPVPMDDIKSVSNDDIATPEKQIEKQQKDDDIKDNKALPPKERGKRIFKSRNRSRLSEGDSFSNDEKSPTKDANQSFDSIEKSFADSTMESPKITEIETVPIESVAKEEEEEVNSSFKSEESQIESEVANTLITLTNSPIKVPESTIVTSSDKDVPSTEVQVELPKPKDSPQKTEVIVVVEPETPTISRNLKTTADETPEEIVMEQPKECAVINVAVAKKRKSINENEGTNSDCELTATPNTPIKQLKIADIVENTTQQVNKRSIVKLNVAETSSQIRDAGDGLLIKTNPNVIVPKVVPSEISAVSSTSSASQKHQQQPQQQTQKQTQSQSQSHPQPPQQHQQQQSPQQQQQSPQQQQPKKSPRMSQKSKKVAVTIGYDLQGNTIVTYRKPSDRPVVHLPSHIQTPDMVQSVNPALLHTAKSNSSTQFVITSKGALIKTTSNTITTQTATTSISARPLSQVVRSSASTSYSPQIRSPPMPTIHVQTHQSINPHLIHKQPSMVHKQTNQQFQKQQFIQHQYKAGGQVKPKITTNIVQHQQSIIQKQNVKTPSRPNKKQQEMLMRKQQEMQANAIADQAQPTEVLQNAEDNQLLAVPAESFNGPEGAFYLCRITEQQEYVPIDHQPLYLDEKNQLIPGSLINAGIQEELIEETMVPQASQQFEYQQEQVVQNVEEPSNFKYILNVDGQQILLDQQSLLQLTSGGEMQQIVTADGQRLILQGSPQDILAAIQSNQQEQIIIPEDMIEEDPNNHDILAAALEDTGVFPQEQYIGDVLQIQTGNGIEVDPLAFQTINQAATSETNAILPPIMSTLEQPSKSDVASPNVDCSNLDESLAVIGVTVPSTNVPTSLELPITITNPAIAPKCTTSAITTIYPSNVPTTLPPQALQTSHMSISSDILHAAGSSSIARSNSALRRGGSSLDGSRAEAVLIQDDENCEIVPNTPESVINHGFTSDNSNSSEIPLQSNIILRQPSIESERDETENGDTADRRQHNNSHEPPLSPQELQEQQEIHNTENSRSDVVDSLILNENSFDHHDAALLLAANSRPGFQAITIDNNHESNASHTNRNTRRNRHRNTNHSNATASNENEPHIFIIEQHMIGNSEYDTDDVTNVENFNS